MRAILYTRVSTTEQAANGASLAVQESKLRAYCVALDIEVVAVEIDAGISAKSLKRPALQRALAALRSGAADTLVISRLDRLSRSTRDILDLAEDYFADGKRTLISLHESIDTHTPAGRLVLTVLGALAQFEREKTGERVAEVRGALAAEGRFLGGAVPYGFVVDGDKLVECEPEQAVIARAREYRARGMALRAVADTLAAGGFVARSGKAFAASAISAMCPAV